MSNDLLKLFSRNQLKAFRLRQFGSNAQLLIKVCIKHFAAASDLHHWQAIDGSLRRIRINFNGEILQSTAHQSLIKLDSHSSSKQLAEEFTRLESLSHKITLPHRAGSCWMEATDEKSCGIPISAFN